MIWRLSIHFESFQKSPIRGYQAWYNKSSHGKNNYQRNIPEFYWFSSLNYTNHLKKAKRSLIPLSQRISLERLESPTLSNYCHNMSVWASKSRFLPCSNQLRITFSTLWGWGGGGGRGGGWQGIRLLHPIATSIIFHFRPGILCKSCAYWMAYFCNL